jgi:hypothetical protein
MLHIEKNGQLLNTLERFYIVTWRLKAGMVVTKDDHC